MGQPVQPECLQGISSSLERFPALAVLRESALRFSRFWNSSHSQGATENVGLMSDGDNPDLFAAVMGIWYTGRSVVPVGIGESPDRLRRISSESGLERIFVLQGTPAAERRLREENLPVKLLPATPADSSETAPVSPLPHSPAFLIHTSGSTGAPKKVTVRWSHLDNWFKNSWNQFGPFPAGSCFLNLFGWTFDAWFEPYFWGLSSGMRVESTTPIDLLRRSRHFARLKPHTLTLTPSQAPFVMALPNLDEWRNTLRRTIFGGEILDASLARSWRARFPQSTIENSYGPSETTCTIFHHRISPNEEILPLGGPLPIGSPHSGVITRIEAGVLWVSTEQITNENREFIPAHGANVPWYNTGDIVRCDRDNVFTVLGREDNLVKVGGRRVHLEEIDSAFLAAGTELCSLQDPNSGELIGVTFEEASLDSLSSAAEKARAQLPAGVLPKRFFFCPARPLGAAGKTDRAAIKEAFLQKKLREIRAN